MWLLYTGKRRHIKIIEEEKQLLQQEKQIVVRVHPEVALRVIEEEPGLLKRLRNQTRLRLDLRDDPLMRLDEFRLLSGPAETDVTNKYVAA